MSKINFIFTYILFIELYELFLKLLTSLIYSDTYFIIKIEVPQNMEVYNWKNERKYRTSFVKHDEDLWPRIKNRPSMFFPLLFLCSNNLHLWLRYFSSLLFFLFVLLVFFLIALPFWDQCQFHGKIWGLFNFFSPLRLPAMSICRSAKPMVWSTYSRCWVFTAACTQ